MRGGDRTESFHQYHTVNIRRDGVTLICARFRFFEIDIPFYRELAELCETWLRNTLAAKAEEQYEAFPSSKRHFFFPRYEYLFELSELTRTSESITVRLIVSLSRRGEAELSRYESTQTHRLSDLKILPPKAKKKA